MQPIVNNENKNSVQFEASSPSLFSLTRWHGQFRQLCATEFPALHQHVRIACKVDLLFFLQEPHSDAHADAQPAPTEHVKSAYEQQREQQRLEAQQAQERRQIQLKQDALRAERERVMKEREQRVREQHDREQLQHREADIREQILKEEQHRSGHVEVEPDPEDDPNNQGEDEFEEAEDERAPHRDAEDDEEEPAARSQHIDAHPEQPAVDDELVMAGNPDQQEDTLDEQYQEEGEDEVQTRVLRWIPEDEVEEDGEDPYNEDNIEQVGHYHISLDVSHFIMKIMCVWKRHFMRIRGYVG
uniref:Golgi integral membrane protein 4a n=1 Tax=Neogobius melanostomus TaxID=47308 RepID=A0A8C6T7Y7_9GOBI